MINQMKFMLLPALFFSGQLAFSQESNTGCPMCGSMGIGGMILFAVLVLAIIAVLISLSIFLIRRSRNQ